MLEKIAAIENRYEELNRLIEENAADYQVVVELAKEKSDLEEIVTTAREYRLVQQSLQEAQVLSQLVGFARNRPENQYLAATVIGRDPSPFLHYVIIDHGNGYRTLYAHMLNNSIVVKPGQKVSQGQKLGIMGSTGRSTGPHLHFEIKTSKGNVNPLQLLK